MSLLSASTVTRIAANVRISRRKRQRQTLRRQCWQVNSAAQYAVARWQLSRCSARDVGQPPADVQAETAPAERGSSTTLQPAEPRSLDLPTVRRAGSGGGEHSICRRVNGTASSVERRWNQASGRCAAINSASPSPVRRRDEPHVARAVRWESAVRRSALLTTAKRLGEADRFADGVEPFTLRRLQRVADQRVSHRAPTAPGRPAQLAASARARLRLPADRPSRASPRRRSAAPASRRSPSRRRARRGSCRAGRTRSPADSRPAR